MCVSGMGMTTAIIILGRWSDLTPTNYVWPASQDRVPSVWCCPTPHWLVNEGLRGGGRVGRQWFKVVVVEREGQQSKRVGWASLTLLLQLQTCIGPAVDSQLLCHYNKQRPHKSQPAVQSGQSGTLASSAGPPEKKAQRSISPLSLRKQSCLYWTRCEERLTAFFSLPPFPFFPHLYLFPPSCFFISLAPLPAVFLVSPSCLPSSFFNLFLWNKSTAVSDSLWASAPAIKQTTALRLQPFVWLLIQRVDRNFLSWLSVAVLLLVNQTVLVSRFCSIK